MVFDQFDAIGLSPELAKSIFHKHKLWRFLFRLLNTIVAVLYLKVLILRQHFNPISHAERNARLRL